MEKVKKILNFLFSMQFMGIIVILLALSMAVATFVENRNGTIAAQALIYQAWWFELAIFLAFINILASIIKQKLYNLKRLPIFLFHFAFLLIILGAALTRFVGKEGIMHIREGEATSAYLSADTYFYVKAESKSGTVEKTSRVYLSPASKKNVSMSLKLGPDKIKIHSIDYVTGEQMSRSGMSGVNKDHPDIAQVRVTINKGSEEVMVRGKQKDAYISNEFEISGIKLTLSFGSKPMELPFQLALNDFQLDRYPGSNSPSSFASEVTLIDKANNVTKPYRIFMNNILTHRGYRFYQSSYDMDEKGTILSVNHDGLGTGVTYVGYFSMFAFIILAFFAPGGRFRRLLKESRKTVAAASVLLLMLVLPSIRLNAQSNPITPNAEEAKEFGKMWVLGSEGRLKPVSTLAQEMVRKVFGENRYEGMSAEQLWLSMLIEPEKWANKPIIGIKSSEIAREFSITGGKASYNDFFNKDQYQMGDMVNEAYMKRPNQRNGQDKELIKLDEALNIVYMTITGELLQIYPDPADPKAKWHTPAAAIPGLSEGDSLMIKTSFPVYLDALRAGDLARAAEIRKGIIEFQKRYGGSIIPSDRKAHLEVVYNKALIFERLAIFYATIGLLFLAIQLWSLFKTVKWHKPVSRAFGVLLFAGWVLHTVGLGLRWYLSGHAPMSNGYESMIFVAWGTLLAGFLVAKRSMLPLALTGVLAALSLLVAHMSWMNPQITPLVPVLKSVWLTIHVAVIMTSYSFLGLGALIGLISMILFISKTKANQALVNGHIAHLTRLNKIVLIAGLYLITIGCFLGAIWANQSWGRYWGWDPKETWCLISILVYSFIVHMNHIKGFESDFAFNFGSVMGFGSILMTYFGVNYFLGGMHSYAGGDTPTMPVGVYASLVILVILVYVAYFNELRFNKKA